jgi:anti-sigma regulatory factor (Ser/Thr protein kinase)
MVSVGFLKVRRLAVKVPEVEGLRIPATSTAARRVRHRVRAACAGLTVEQKGVAELLTNELVSNAVCHADGDAPDSGAEIVVYVYRVAEVVRVEVQDHDSRPLPPVRRPSTPLEPGMGLYLVANLATAWGSVPHGDGKVVWFELGTCPTTETR